MHGNTYAYGLDGPGSNTGGESDYLFSKTTQTRSEARPASYWKSTGVPSRWYKCADKFLARQGRKQVNVTVRIAWISFGALPCRKKKLEDSPRLDVVEIARIPDMLPGLFHRATDLSARRPNGGGVKLNTRRI